MKMKITRIITLIMVLAMLVVFTACAPTPCDVCIDGNDDGVCDVCKSILCDHVDLNGDEICEFCGGELEHTNHKDESGDGKCDKCEKCLTHNDALEDGDAKCDNCGVCVYHAKDDAKDLTCDVCGESYTLTTIADALAIAQALADGETTPVRYYIYATVSSVTNPTYGGMYLEDETGSMSVYGTYSADGSIGYAAMTEQPGKGDKVLVACVLKNYQGAGEINNARLIAFDDVPFDNTKYTEMDIADARDAEKGTFIKLTGTVARITYAGGTSCKPAGVMLVDNTSSIYVYDAYLASVVSIGNTITVAGEKDYWIRDQEVNFAEKFGYNGCNQLTDVYLLSNDNLITEFDKSWIEEISIKDLLDTPVTSNITTLVYKTTALILKDDSNTWINYGIMDLDGETGSYVYTQCDGVDFAWLDQYVGKICTVYITAFNAKSVDSSCFFRFIPVEVIDEGYTFDLDETPEFVMEYHALSQFLATYTGNPNKILHTSISSTLLGFENATISYSSNNTAVVDFVIDGETVTLVCGEDGEAVVIVTVTYNGETVSEDITIKVDTSLASEYSTVRDAIDAPVGEEITVKGIVGASTVHVNKFGFYIIDETGAIAVVVKGTDIFESISIGDEVVIKGIRQTIDSEKMAYLDEVTLVTNLYGSHDVPTDSYITDKNISEIYATTDTTQIYTTKVIIKRTEGSYPTYKICTLDGTELQNIYYNNGTAFVFLDDYLNQEVQVDISVCNWNGKKTQFAIHAVYTEDGKIYCENNFDKF